MTEVTQFVFANCRRMVNSQQPYLTAPADFATVGAVAACLAFAKEIFVAHDRFAGMAVLAMRDICVVIGNADHQPRGAQDATGDGYKVMGFALEHFSTPLQPR